MENDESDGPALMRVVPRAMCGARLDEVLDRLVESRSRAALQRAVRRGRVRVDGRRVLRSNVRVQGGEVLVVAADGPRGGAAGAEHAPRARAAVPGGEPAVLHADDEVAVIDKPAGTLVHAADRRSGRTVADFAAQRFGALPTLLGVHRPGIVHRLDRDTSGVMVLARTERAMQDLRAQFRARRVEKRYVALCHGAPASDRWRIERPLEPVGDHPDRQRIAPRGRGRPAVTEVQVLERLGGYCLLACTPRTGRRHQLRLHFKHMSCPIIGDVNYGDGRHNRRFRRHHGLHRLALHAFELRLLHPRTARPLRLRAPLPEDLRLALASWSPDALLWLPEGLRPIALA